MASSSRFVLARGQVEGPVSLKWPLHRVWTQDSWEGLFPGLFQDSQLPQSLGLLG